MWPQFIIKQEFNRAYIEKFSDTYMALLHLAAAIIAYRKVGVIYG